MYLHSQADDGRSRSGDVVEQIMKPQWWISCKPMAEEALRVSERVPRRLVSDAFTGDPRWRAQDPTKNVSRRVDQVDGKHAGLVYLASVVVGTSMSCLFDQGRGTGSRRK